MKNVRPTPSNHSPRAAFTLLEVVLALSLSVVVLAILGMSMQTTIRATHTGRTDVARAQLARAVLRRIADDLRSTVRSIPVDTSQLKASVSAAAASALGGAAGAGGAPTGGNPAGGGGSQSGGGGSQPAGGGGAAGAGATGGGAAGGSSTGGASAGASGTSGTGITSSVADPLDVPAMPGLYGQTDWVEVDVSRPGDLEAYTWTPDGGAAQTGDLKTVSYFLGNSREMTGGLLRRELDRAASMYATESGGEAGLDEEASSFAPEVAALQFRYHDGTTWLDEWDSQNADGLPMAVEISVAIADDALSAAGMAVGSDLAAENVTWYRLLVDLPAAEPAQQNSSSQQEEGSTTGGSQAGAGATSGGSSAAGGGGRQ